jgi:benzoyl-CoA reductase/2-hydroxyglutaryl-CoA dehydratase subunit BcrC/BadD/HgdB
MQVQGRMRDIFGDEGETMKSFDEQFTSLKKYRGEMISIAYIMDYCLDKQKAREEIEKLKQTCEARIKEGESKLKGNESYPDFQRQTGIICGCNIILRRLGL